MCGEYQERKDTWEREEQQAEQQRRQLESIDPEQWVQDTLETEELLG